MKPSRASAIEGAISCASVNFPEPYFAMRERKARNRSRHADAEARRDRLLRIGIAKHVEKAFAGNRSGRVSR